MNCRRAKTLINDFIDGVIGDRDRSMLEQHLNDCKSCESLATGLSKSLELVHRLEPIQPDENFNWKVRLRIAQEKRELADAAVQERGWMKAWNRRFALSALSAFVGVVAIGYIATNIAVLPNSPQTPTLDTGTLAQDLPPEADVMSSNDDIEVASADKKLTEKTEREPRILGVRGSVNPTPVVTGGAPTLGVRSPGALEEETGPVLELNKLLTQSRQNAISEYRMLQLQSQVELLSSKLVECGKRCGDEHK